MSATVLSHNKTYIFDDNNSANSIIRRPSLNPIGPDDNEESKRKKNYFKQLNIEINLKTNRKLLIVWH